MKLHFNPGALLNKAHCGSVLALLSEDTHRHRHTLPGTHICKNNTCTCPAHMHTCIYVIYIHSVPVLCLQKVIKPNEALQGHAAFSVFFEMMRGFVARPQWNKRV